MENQVSAIVCPNCGANTSNRLNCEYCGSMLVRFTDHGISIDPTKYGNEAKAIDGLEEALAGNLSLQETCGENEYVITNIIRDMDPQRIQFIQSDAATIGITGVNPLKNASKGNISLRIPFSVRSNDDEVMMNARETLDKFRQLDCFSLFTPQQNEDGIAYYIDFGKDAQTAAQVFTQVMKELDMYEALFDFQTIIRSKEDLAIAGTGDLISTAEYKQQKKYIKFQVIGWTALIVFFGLLILLASL